MAKKKAATPRKKPSRAKATTVDSTSWIDYDFNTLGNLHRMWSEVQKQFEMRICESAFSEDDCYEDGLIRQQYVVDPVTGQSHWESEKTIPALHRILDIEGKLGPNEWRDVANARLGLNIGSHDPMNWAMATRIGKAIKREIAQQRRRQPERSNDKANAKTAVVASHHPDGPESPRTLWLNGKHVQMTPKAFKMICCVWGKEKVLIEHVEGRVWDGQHELRPAYNTFSNHLGKMNDALLEVGATFSFHRDGKFLVRVS